MRKLFLLFFISFVSFVSAETLSDKSKVSLLTCGAGEELYAQFGHTAIRIQDSSLNIDVVFNYGTFNFRTPNFYAKFVKGITDYELGIDFGISFFMRYNEMIVPVWEQDLNMTQAEKQSLFDALMRNYEPQNRFYRYNFIYDNCATRPRDMIENAVGGINYVPLKSNETFRDLITHYIGQDTWIKFGIDMVVGAPADVPATLRERMFLPMDLMNSFQTAKKKDGSPIVTAKTTALNLPARRPVSPLITPLVASLAFMLLIVLATYIWRNKCLLWLDVVLFTAASLMGLIIFYLNFFSVHPMVNPNYNLFWLHPFYLIFVLLLPFKKTYKILSYLQLLFALMLIVAIGGYLYFPQQFHPAFLPLMLVLLVRSIHFVRMQEVFQTKKSL